MSVGRCVVMGNGIPGLCAVPDMHRGSTANLEESLADSEIAAGGLRVDLLKVARLAGGASEAPGRVEKAVGSRRGQRDAEWWTRPSACRKGTRLGRGLLWARWPALVTDGLARSVGCAEEQQYSSQAHQKLRWHAESTISPPIQSAPQGQPREQLEPTTARAHGGGQGPCAERLRAVMARITGAERPRTIADDPQFTPPPKGSERVASAGTRARARPSATLLGAE